jgi:predicted nucleotidyltransferase
MPNITQTLFHNGLIKPDKFVVDGIQYETIMGSYAYGVSSDSSDMDVYGFCIPPKEVVFPHLKGEINGFGRQIQRFEQFSQHHVKYNAKQYDITIYNIVKYFQLCTENNPNMIDSLFTPANCVMTATKVGQMVRDNRRLFLHKGAWHKFKGYAYSQMHKIKTKDPKGSRRDMVDTYGYDVKFAYHVVRLLDEVEQILIEGDIDLQRNREQLKSIRRGEWTELQIEEYFTTKERELEKVYLDSKLQHSPDEGKVKQLLLDCLEEFYGSLNGCVVNVDAAMQTLMDIKALIEKVVR